MEQKSLVMAHVKKIADKYIKNQSFGEDFEFSAAMSHDLILKEIANTLSQRKKLHAQVSTLETELTVMEKATEERKAVISSVTPIVQQPPAVQQPSAAAPMTAAPQKHHSRDSSSKHRKNRENRARSQEWPDIPDVGKIEESNPEVLAQKILETGRQIEAGKLLATGAGKTQQHEKKSSHGDSALMPAPPAVNKSSRQVVNMQQQQQQQVSQPQVQKMAYLQPQQLMAQQMQHVQQQQPQLKLKESPHKINFEDRLKSFISSALQDQEHAPQPVKNQAPPQVIATSVESSHKKREYPTQSSSSSMYHHQAPKVYIQQAANNARESPALPPGTHHLTPSTTITPTNISPYKQQHVPQNHPSSTKMAAQQQAKYGGGGGGQQQVPAFPQGGKNMSISISPSNPHDRHAPSISPNSLLYHQQQQQSYHQQIAAAAAAAEYHHQQRMEKIEFKTPPDTYRDRQQMVVHEQVSRGGEHVRIPREVQQQPPPEDYGRDSRISYVQVGEFSFEPYFFLSDRGKPM